MSPLWGLATGEIRVRWGARHSDSGFTPTGKMPVPHKKTELLIRSLSHNQLNTEN
jgi:hypothetical protein